MAIIKNRSKRLADYCSIEAADIGLWWSII